MNPGRVRHVLVDHFDDADSGPVAFESERLPDVASKSDRCALRLQSDAATRETAGIQPAENEVCIRHRRALSAPPVAGWTWLGAGTPGPDLETVDLVDARDRPAASADLHHLDDRNTNRKTASLQVTVPAGNLEGSGALRHPVLDQADLRGRPAHIKRKRFLETAFACHVASEDRSPGRAGLDEPDGKLRRVFDGGDATARHHQIKRASQPPGAQTLAQAKEIPGDQRPDIGVCAGGGETLVLPDLGTDLAREADGNSRKLVGQDFTDLPLVIGMGVGVQEPDRDRLNSGRPPVRSDLPHPRNIERNHDLALGRHPLIDLPSERAWHKRVGLVHEDVILFKSLLESHLQDIAKASCGQERGPCPFSLDQGVRRKGRTVDEDIDIRRRNSGFTQNQVKGLENADLRCPRSRQDLGGATPHRRVENDVGEGATNIRGEPVFLVHVSSASETERPGCLRRRTSPCHHRSTIPASLSSGSSECQTNLNGDSRIVR